MQNETVIFMSGGGSGMGEENGKPSEKDIQGKKIEAGGKKADEIKRGGPMPPRGDPPEPRKDHFDEFIKALDLNTEEKKEVKEKLSEFKITGKEKPKFAGQKDEDRKREEISASDFIDRIKKGFEEFKNTEKMSEGLVNDINVLSDVLGKKFDKKDEKDEDKKKREDGEKEIRDILVKDVFGGGDEKKGEAIRETFEGFVKTMGDVREGKMDLEGLVKFAGDRGVEMPSISDDELTPKAGSAAGDQAGGTKAESGGSSGGGGGKDGATASSAAPGEGKPGGAGGAGGADEKKEKSKLARRLEWLADKLVSPDTWRKGGQNLILLMMLFVAFEFGVVMRAEAEAIEKITTGH